MTPRIGFRRELTTPAHTTLAIWVNGALAGRLTVRTDEVAVLEWIEKALLQGVSGEQPPLSE